MVVCAVFVPVMFISGQTGMLFRELAVAMMGAIAFSGFLALSLAPMLCSKLLRHENRGRLTQLVDERFKWLEMRYSRLLDRVLLRPRYVIVGISILLVAAVGLFTTLHSELVPTEDVGVVQTQISAPEGTGFAQMNSYMRSVEQKILPMIDDGPVRTFLSRVPAGFNASEDFNGGNINVFLKPWEDRDVTTQDVVGQINRMLRQMPAIRGNAAARSSLGRGRGQPINFVIAGPTYADLARARDRILAAAASNQGIVNLDSDYKETKPQLRVDVDTTRAGDMGVSVQAVSQALQSLLGSRRVSTYIDRGEEYRVIVQAEASARSTEANLASIYVRSNRGELIPLSNLVKLREVAGARDLGRYNKMRAITLQGSLSPGYTLGEALTFIEQQALSAP
jgi:multidrug efflux pump